MEQTTYQMRVNREKHRDSAIIEGLKLESLAGNKTAQRTLNRIDEIDDLLQGINRRQGKKHDRHIARINRVTDHEFSKVLLKEKNMLLRIAGKGGFPRAYLLKLRT